MPLKMVCLENKHLNGHHLELTRSHRTSLEVLHEVWKFLMTSWTSTSKKRKRIDGSSGRSTSKRSRTFCGHLKCS